MCEISCVMHVNSKGSKIHQEDQWNPLVKKRISQNKFYLMNNNDNKHQSMPFIFFDKSICYIKKRKRGVTLSTLGVYKGDQGEKENKVRKSTKLIARGASQPVVQEKRVTRKKWRSSSRVLGESSKHLSFRSLQMHHKIQ
jgi:hypothetical protein